MDRQMMQQRESIVLGLGVTGMSVIRHLQAERRPLRVVDTRQQPPGLDELRRNFPHIPVELGPLRQETLLQAGQLIVSPGLGLNRPEIEAARQAGIEISGDIDLFSREANRPIVAVTGSNGKSSVVMLTALILDQAGKKVGLGGNLESTHGRPALDLLREPADVYVLELSSFQLETTSNLQAEVATVLNVTADHMDRYDSLDQYRQAKLRIFNGCRQAVVERNQGAMRAALTANVRVWDYGFDRPGPNGVGIVDEGNGEFLTFQSERILALSDLQLIGRHNLANVMAATGLALAMGIDSGAIAAGIRAFKGLPHRCQWVARIAGVDYVNDSKATNVDSALAALEGLGARAIGRLIWLGGGIGKGADFAPLAAPLGRYARAAILLGQDADQIAAAVGAAVPVHGVADLEEAVVTAQRLAQPGDTVLLSPACASLDMFDSFEHRGRAFTTAVEALT